MSDDEDLVHCHFCHKRHCCTGCAAKDGWDTTLAPKQPGQKKPQAVVDRCPACREKQNEP